MNTQSQTQVSQYFTDTETVQEAVQAVGLDAGDKVDSDDDIKP